MLSVLVKCLVSYNPAAETVEFCRALQEDWRLRGFYKKSTLFFDE